MESNPGTTFLTPRRDGRLIVSMAVVLLLPSFLFVATGASSLAPGMLMASGLVCLLNVRHLLNFRFSFPVVVLLAIFGLALVSAVFSLLDQAVHKPIMSLVILLVLVSALVLGRRISDMEPEATRRSLSWLVGFLLLLGWLAIVWSPRFSGYAPLEKPVFPFSEESHYALALGVLACGMVYAETTLKSLFILGNMLALALAFPNLTLLVFVFIGCFVFSMRFPRLVFWSIFLAGGLALLLGYFFVLPQFTYFADRLDFSDTTNLTTLVYLQGWGLAWLNMLDTQGLGLGFQMLGEAGTRYPHYTDRIVELTGQEFNISDAGFLAAKWIAELGWFGSLMAVAFLAFLLGFACVGNALRRQLKYLPEVDRARHVRRLWLLGSIFGFVVEVFLRGYGYFSPGVFWIIASLYALHCDRARSLT
ncbi:hypothetical protein P1P91_05860 [Halomonas piscis]|uniref:O-antigen ligase domain-containing protein n=1 Tax=Halomonas piscis TaxID=3031727 RepID=A0ABY9Z244_9GAMM|nr:hypothetical protein [Halomonas piscis]WNK21198.1 hypothetical protein P1P91_05860 [Halomonas piscis]